MGYLQFSTIIFILYIEEFFGVLLICSLLFFTLVYSIKNFKKHNKKKCWVDFIGIVLSVVLLGVIVVFPLSDIIADIPHVVYKDFSVTTGVVVSQNAAGSNELKEKRGFEISDMTSGEIIKIHAIYTPIRQGEIYEVVYLPHTGNGAIVKKLDNQGGPMKPIRGRFWEPIRGRFYD